MTPIIISSLNNITEAVHTFISQMGTDTLFAFYGKMGAGKTTFIKALCQELGVTDTVTSPTFAIVNEHQDARHQPISHFDFYRIKRPAEVLDIGFEDYTGSGHLCLMEWPELIEDFLPDDTRRIQIEEQADGTRVLSEKEA